LYNYLELSVIYASIAQTYNDLDKTPEAIKYFQLEMDTCSLNSESECKSLLNIAILKEKVQVEFEQLENIFKRAHEKAKEASNIQLQLKTMNLLRESQKLYRIDCEGTTKIINSLVEINKIKSNQSEESEKGTSDEDESEKDDNEDAESLVFSSDSDEDEMHQNNLFDEEKTVKQKSTAKRSIVKRNLRGETQLHVACIKGNYNLAKKLIEEGHPVNERDNLNWLPIHEACNYGHVQLVDLLIKHGAKVNDSIGPITPLHDAAQNGHLEVVRLLLKGGALSYVFTQEGYTPLDFLCKYKEDNEKNLNTSDIILYEELYGLMLNSIRGKDRNYKIKKVVFTDEDVVVETSNDADEEKLYSKSAAKTSKNKLFDLDDEDDPSDEDGSDSGRSKDHDKTKKKKKAVSQYKQAINSIGSKSTSGTATMTLGKKGVDKVIVSEKEYSITEDWLINDLNSKKSLKKQPIKHQATTSTKRKFSSNYDDDGEMFEESEYDGDYLKERKQSKTLSDEDDDGDYEKDFRKISSKKTADNSIQLPSSKKRLTDTDYDDQVKNRNSTEKVNKENLDIVRDTSNMSLNDNQYDFYNSDIYDNSESAVEGSKQNDSPSKLKGNLNLYFL
jgi:NF-kappa-B inhibitor-like protein 2